MYNDHMLNGRCPQRLLSKGRGARGLRLGVLAVAFVLLLSGCTGSDGASETVGGDEATASGVAGSEAETGSIDPEPDAPASDQDDDVETEVGDTDADLVEVDEITTPQAVEPGTKIRLLTHDSFSHSDGLFDYFTLATGIDVEVVKGGDAGELVSRAVLTAGQPEGDVLFGVDNTFLQRALDADLFVPYKSPGLDQVSDELKLDDTGHVTPIDYGDVCVNYWKESLTGEAPTSIDDLTSAEFAGSFVTQDPETSSPGLAFLLATIAKYGEGAWQDYWAQLVEGGVTVSPGWSDAYYGDFVAGGGDKTLVTSYATSPVAEMLFATVDYDEPPTGVVTDGCFRQVEFAGVLAGTQQPDAAALLIDFMLSDRFQSDIPLNMFVFPASETAEIPDSFAEWAASVDEPLTLTPEEIEAGRSAWTQEWAEIVLR